MKAILPAKQSDFLRISQDHINREIGQRIRDARLMAGMRADNVAAAIGLSPAMMNNVERGKVPIKVAIVVQISQTVNVPLSYFFDGIGRTAMQTPGRWEEGDDEGKNLRMIADISRALVRIKDETIRMMFKRLIEQISKTFETLEKKDSP